MRVEGPHPILAVLGAINVDLVVSGASLPHAGETVSGGVFAQHQGGKGGNQAVAAARALVRGTVGMIGAVGDDQLGAAAIESLRAEDVQTDHVLVTSEAPTGVALIAVDAEGENQISVAPGANASLTATIVIDALETLRPKLLLASLEVSEGAVRAAMVWCHDHQVPTVLNPAPPHAWAHELLPFATHVTPNAHELLALGGTPASVVLIETRGSAGAVVHTGGHATRIPAPSVRPVDSTGAGDCFNGVLAAGLLDGLALEGAVRRAVVAAAISVTRPGARGGMPSRAEIDAARGRA